MNDPEYPNGVIDFKKAKSQLSATKKAQKRADKANGNGGRGPQKHRIFLYLQYLVLLGVLAYMMQLCRA